MRCSTQILPDSKITRSTRSPDLGPESPFETGGIPVARDRITEHFGVS